MQPAMSPFGALTIPKSSIVTSIPRGGRLSADRRQTPADPVESDILVVAFPEDAGNDEDVAGAECLGGPQKLLGPAGAGLRGVMDEVDVREDRQNAQSIVREEPTESIAVGQEREFRHKPVESHGPCFGQGLFNGDVALFREVDHVVVEDGQMAAILHRCQARSRTFIAIAGSIKPLYNILLELFSLFWRSGFRNGVRGIV